MVLYFLTLSFLSIFLIYFFYLRSPIPISPLMGITVLILSGFVFLFWLFSIKLDISGGLIFGLVGAFVLLLLPLNGPFVSLASYCLGTIFYQFFIGDIPLRPKVGNVLVNTVNYGFPLFLTFKFGPALFLIPSPSSFDLYDPYVLLLALTKMLTLLTLTDILVMSIYCSILDNQNYFKMVRERLRFTNMFIDYFALMLFPGLAYCAAGFWVDRDFLAAVGLFMPFLITRIAMQSLHKERDEFKATLPTIGEIVESKDPYTQYHQGHVSEYSETIAYFLGCDQATAERVKLAGEVHDLGKIGTDDTILNKAGKLTPDEYMHIKEHTMLDELLQKIPPDFPMREIIHLGRLHHQWYDGDQRGYPFNLTREQIPIEARILKVADYWDARTSDRAYHVGITEEECLEALKEGAGKEFDPKVVAAIEEAWKQRAVRSGKHPKMELTPPEQWVIPPPELPEEKPQPSIPRNIRFRNRAFDIAFNTQNIMNGIVTPIRAKLRSLGFIRIFAMLVILIGTAYYCSSANYPIHNKQIVLITALAFLFEFMEVKIPKILPIYPGDFAYLALALLLPIDKFVLVLCLGSFLRLVHYLLQGDATTPQVRRAHFWRLLNRLMIFSLTSIFFRWINLGSQHSTDVPFVEALKSQWVLLGKLLLWAFLASLLGFALVRLETLASRSFRSISLYLPTLTHLFFVNAGLVAAFGWWLYSVYASVHVQFLYGFVGLVLIVTGSYPWVKKLIHAIEGSQQTMEAIVDFADKRLPYSLGRSKAASFLAMKTADGLGLSEEELERLGRISYIYDLGKLGISTALLKKLEKLTADEMLQAHAHIMYGARIAVKYSLYQDDVNALFHHHERWDGMGYPFGLVGKRIPLGARILAVVDTFVAITRDRGYRKALSIEEAAKELQNSVDSSFDPKVVEVFCKETVPSYLRWQQKNNR